MYKDMKVSDLLNEYGKNHDGALGCIIERLITEKEYTKKQGIPDYIHGKHYGIKTGAGTLDYGNGYSKGETIIIYIPIVNVQEKLKFQDGVVCKREDFLTAMEKAKLIRHNKKTTQGTISPIAIQTFYNRKTGYYNKKALARMAEELNAVKIMTFREFCED